jgi:hypothetical protein
MAEDGATPRDVTGSEPSTRRLDHLRPFQFKPGQSGYTGPVRRRLSVNAIKRVIGDAEEQLRVLARIARGEAIRVSDELVDGRKVTRLLKPNMNDVRRAAVYLVDRRWGRLPAYVAEEAQNEPEAALPVIPPELEPAVRELARRLVLGVADQTQTVDVSPVGCEKAHSHNQTDAGDAASHLEPEPTTSGATRAEKREGVGGPASGAPSPHLGPPDTSVCTDHRGPIADDLLRPDRGPIPAELMEPDKGSHPAADPENRGDSTSGRTDRGI